MVSRLAGAYTVRASERFSADVIIDMWTPLPPSENMTRGWPAAVPAQVSPDALGSRRLGAPPSAGTVQVSQSGTLPTTVYAMRAPFGWNTGLILDLPSCVSRVGSP